MKQKVLVRKELKNNSKWRKRSGWKGEYEKGIKYTSSEKVPGGGLTARGFRKVDSAEVVRGTPAISG